MKIAPFLIFGLLLVPTAMPASDTLSVEACRSLALDFLEEGCLDSVAHYQNLAAQLCEEEEDLKGWISIHRRVGQAFRSRENYPMALQYFGRIFEEAWREPCTDEEYQQLAWALTDVGYTYKLMNAFQYTTSYYQRAATIFKDRLGESNSPLSARYIYSELGNAYSRLREYPKAEFYLGKRKDILAKSGGDLAAQAFNDLGMLYFNWEKYPKAAQVFEEGLTAGEISLATTLLLLTNLGMAYYEMGNLEKALDCTHQGKAQINHSALPQREKEERLIWINENLARIHKADSAYTQSEQHYNEALALAFNRRPGNRRATALLHIGRAGLFLQMGQIERSLSDYHLALQLFLPDFRDTSRISLPTEQQLTAEPNLIEALGGKARCFRAQFEATREERPLRKALESYKLAGQAELLLHQFYVLEGARLTAVKEHRWVREEALEAAFELWRRNPTPELEGQLFALMEGNRAMLLLEDLKASAFMAHESGKAGFYSSYRNTREATVYLEEALFAEQQKGAAANKAKLDSLYEQLLLAKEQKAIATRQILSESAGRALIEPNQGPAIPTVQQALGEDRVLLEYFLGEKQAYLVAISQTAFYAWKIESPADIKEQALALREVWSGQPMLKAKTHKPRFARSAHLLHQWLLADALAWIAPKANRLVVVTDGVLGYIPFEVLIRTEPEGNFDFASLEYLVQDYSVSYAPSAGLFAMQSQKRPGSAARLFAGFAPDYPSNAIARVDTSSPLLASLVREGNYELRGAKEEVKQVCNLLNGAQFTGPAASEKAFKEQAGKYKLLLLSMHSLINEDHPGFSRMLFTSGASEGAEDDLLNALELNTLSLKADLAVLSACNTGYGKLYEGEGVMSLSRSFFLAGVPSTVMTLWKIPDTQSSAIVLSFFKNLKAGMPKDVALQQAKRSYLENLDTPEEGYPYFWAGFIAAGNAEPLVINPTGEPGGWVWEILALAFFLFIYLRTHVGKRAH